MFYLWSAIVVETTPLFGTTDLLCRSPAFFFHPQVTAAQRHTNFSHGQSLNSNPFAVRCKIIVSCTVVWSGIDGFAPFLQPYLDLHGEHVSTQTTLLHCSDNTSCHGDPHADLCHIGEYYGLQQGDCNTHSMQESVAWSTRHQ